jgi:hypothetical protein
MVGVVAWAAGTHISAAANKLPIANSFENFIVCSPLNFLSALLGSFACELATPTHHLDAARLGGQ